MNKKLLGFIILLITMWVVHSIHAKSLNSTEQSIRDNLAKQEPQQVN